MSANKSNKKVFEFRFYAELNDFLPSAHRQVSFKAAFKTPVTVGEVLLSLGIPFSEIDLILVNNESVSLSHKLIENDRIAVYPVFESMNVSGNTKLRDEGLRITKFILDCHLGKLAKYLRMLGFDTRYKNNFSDDEIRDIANKENRIILTRDKLLLCTQNVTHGYYIRTIDKHKQLSEVVNKFDLYSQFKSFTRCMTCNEPLTQIVKDKVIDKIDKPDILETFSDFWYCWQCDKVFWKGSHFQRMENYIRELIVNHEFI